MPLSSTLLLELAGLSEVWVDVTIGSDYYWRLVMGSICRGVEVPIAVHMTFGSVLSGPSCLTTQEHCAMNLSATYVLHAETHSVDMCSNFMLSGNWKSSASKMRRKLYDVFVGSAVSEEG